MQYGAQECLLVRMAVNIPLVQHRFQRVARLGSWGGRGSLPHQGRVSAIFATSKGARFYHRS
jgi:hypothetical protein